MESQKPFKIEESKATVNRPGVKRINIWYGPYKIRGKRVRKRN